MRVNMRQNFQTEFKAWSSDFIIEIINGSENPDKIVREIKTLLSEYEQSFSRFLQGSQLTALNNQDAITLTPLWETVLKEAEAISKTLSPAYFNPHVNLAAHGYNRSIEKLGKNAAIQTDKNALLPYPKGLIKKQNKLQLKSHSTLDFGSFLKGYVSQQIADQYADACQGLIVNFGGDLTVRGQDEEKSEFEIGIFNPVTKEDHWVKLNQASLCTSGIYKRRWLQDNQEKHHILNPHLNNQSDSDYVSISFWGQNGALCDAMATAAFNAPVSEWNKWRSKQADINYLAIDKQGHVISSDFK